MIDEVGCSLLSKFQKERDFMKVGSGHSVATGSVRMEKGCSIPALSW